ncbi:cysteine peptidase family C39 domain-containing protein [Staphylococcus felis]|nr:cysteine peptidase family C39 domain-containing protein [Staphylococcus felis]
MNQKGFDHFVIVEKVKRNNLYILDPDKGKYHLSETEFIKIWTNIVLLIEKTENFTTKNVSPSYMRVFLDILKNYGYLFVLILAPFSLI